MPINPNGENPGMLVIGVTGGIGSGKTAATDRFREQGITIVDADLAARIIVEPGTIALEKIREHFGSQMITPEGTLDRKALRKVVFADPEQRKWLEQLTHPLIGQEILRQIQASRSPYTILVSPLLFESGQYRLATRTLVIDVPVDLQISRTLNRDDTDEEGVKAIIAAQIERNARIAKADDLICNDQDLSHLYREVDKLHSQYLTLAKGEQP